MKTRFLTTALALTAISLTAAQRMPTVNYTVTGISGNWVLDFNVTNNLLQGEGTLYFFGVQIETGRDIVASPAEWNPDIWPTWDNSGYGGSSTIYNNNWITGGAYEIGSGMSLSGFQARATSVDAPAVVRWFAYAANGTYNGNDYFYSSVNPGFEGTASVVPEPASFSAVVLGIAALLRRRR